MTTCLRFFELMFIIFNIPVLSAVLFLPFSRCDGFSYNATSAVCDLQHDIFCYLNHTGSVTSAVVMSQIKQPCSYSTELARSK